MKPTTRASFLEGFEAFAAARGADYDALLASAGLTRADLSDPANEIDFNAATQVLNAAATATGDPCLGLHWAENYPKHATGVLSYLLLNAKSVRHAVKTLARYVSLHLEPIEVSFEEADGIGHLVWRYPLSFNVPRIQAASFLMALLIIRLRNHAGANWMPMGVELEHRELQHRDEWLRILGPNVSFDQPCNALRIRASVLDRSSSDSDNRLFELIRDLGDRMLAERKAAADIVQRTRKAIVDQLDDGDATLDEVAAAMEMSPRTLQTQLANAQTNFETVLHETRQNLAEIYLRDTDLPLTEIAFLLGFSELSAFTRAANRWFGVPPRLHRAELRRDPG
ncbi:MAG: AraC family transcriptional regulator [Hyphomicrobium sp.]